MPTQVSSPSLPLSAVLITWYDCINYYWIYRSHLKGVWSSQTKQNGWLATPSTPLHQSLIHNWLARGRIRLHVAQHSNYMVKTNLYHLNTAVYSLSRNSSIGAELLEQTLVKPPSKADSSAFFCSSVKWVLFLVAISRQLIAHYLQ